MKWHIDLASEIGGRREQQDRVRAYDVPQRPNDCLVVLADGMGGRAHGGLAAQAVLDAAEQALDELTVDNPRQFLDTLCARAHASILEIGRQNNSNPGSTCVCLYLTHDEAYWAYVGDSRLYHFAADELLTKTRDHTVGELLKDNPDDPRPGAVDRVNEHHLYMCLGGQNEPQAEFGATAIGADDWFMLCSDGFWSQVDADEVTQCLPAFNQDQPNAANLVEMATQRGGVGCDNTSVVLVTRKASFLGKAWRRALTPGRRFGG